MGRHERSVPNLYQFTAIDSKFFPDFDASIEPSEIDKSALPHIRKVIIRGNFVEKTAILENQDIYLEAICAVLINHIAAKKKYYFRDKAIDINGVSYSVSLTPEIPYSLEGETITYYKLPGINAFQESWEKTIDWDEINKREGQKKDIKDLKFHAKLLGLVDKLHNRLLKDIGKVGIELEDHWLGHKQVLLHIDENIRHIFIGIVDFEQITPKTQLMLREIIIETNNFSDVIERLLPKKRRHG